MIYYEIFVIELTKILIFACEEGILDFTGYVSVKPFEAFESFSISSRTPTRHKIFSLPSQVSSSKFDFSKIKENELYVVHNDSKEIGTNVIKLPFPDFGLSKNSSIYQPPSILGISIGYTSPDFEYRNKNNKLDLGIITYNHENLRLERLYFHFVQDDTFIAFLDFACIDSKNELFIIRILFRETAEKTSEISKQLLSDKLKDQVTNTWSSFVGTSMGDLNLTSSLKDIFELTPFFEGTGESLNNQKMRYIVSRPVPITRTNLLDTWLENTKMSIENTILTENIILTKNTRISMENTRISMENTE